MSFMESIFNASFISIFFGILLFLLVILELEKSPWSPYFWLTAVLTLTIPFIFSDPLSLLGGCDWARIWIPTLIVFAVTVVWEVFLCTWFYEKVLLRKFKHETDPFWSVNAAIDAVRRLALTSTGKWEEPAFGLFTLLWAPVAEEIFYCGFLFKSLDASWGIALAIFCTGILFGIRHACHFITLRPLPWPAMLIFAVSAFGSITLNCLLFEKTRNLYPVIGMHFAINLIWAGWQLVVDGARKSTSATT